MIELRLPLDGIAGCECCRWYIMAWSVDEGGFIMRGDLSCCPISGLFGNTPGDHVIFVRKDASIPHWID